MAVYPNGLSTPPYVSDNYGWRIHPLTGLRTFHYGTDSHGHPAGLNYAPEAGTVVFAGWNGGAGNQITIESAGGRQWRLKHHEAFLVSRTQWVNQGDPIGVTGTTGDSTGIHCHTELWIEGVSTDPFAWISNHRTTSAGEIGDLIPQPTGVPMFNLVAVPDTGLIYVVGIDGTRVGVQSQTDLNALVAFRDGMLTPGKPMTQYWGDIIRVTTWYLDQANGDTESVGDNGAHVFSPEELAQIGKAAAIDVPALLAAISQLDNAEHAELLAAINKPRTVA